MASTDDRHAAPAGSWAELVRRHRWDADPDIVAAAAWLDALDRGFTSPGPAEVGRGFGLVAHALARWLYVIDPAWPNRIGVRAGLARLAERLREKCHHSLDQRPCFKRQALFATVLLLDGRAGARDAGTPDVGWDVAHRRLWGRFALVVLYRLGVEIRHQQHVAAEEARLAVAAGLSATPVAHRLEVFPSLVRRLRDTWPTWNAEQCAAWIPRPNLTDPQQPLYPDTAHRVELDDALRAFVIKQRLYTQVRQADGMITFTVPTYLYDLRFVVSGRVRPYCSRIGRGAVSGGPASPQPHPRPIPSPTGTHSPAVAGSPLVPATLFRRRHPSGHDNLTTSNAVPGGPPRASAAGARTGDTRRSQMSDSQRRTMAVRDMAIPSAPHGPLIPRVAEEMAPPAWVPRHARAYHRAQQVQGTAALPLLHRRRALPGASLAALVGPLLGPARFADAGLTCQALFLALLIPASTGLSVYRLCTARLLAPGQRPAPACDVALDAARGILWCRPEPRLQGCLARTGVAAPCEPIHSNHWPLVLPPAIVGLLRLHLSCAGLGRARPDTDGTPHVLWACPDESDGDPPRPLAASDIARYLARAARDLPIAPALSDLVRFAEALTWQADSPVSPGLLPHLAGTYLPRLAVAVAYQAPTPVETASAAATLYTMAVDEIQARLGHASAAGDHLAAWIAEGQAAGGGRTRGLTPSARVQRCGTRRHLELRYVARALATARNGCPDVDTAAPEALAWRAAVEMRIFVALRRPEILRLRRCDVDLAGDAVYVYVRRKGRGVAAMRHDHLAVPAPCMAALAAHVRRSSGRPDARLFSAALIRAVCRALPHGVRHALATSALRHYQALAWTPADWVAMQSALGHEIPGMPCGCDDDTTLGERRRAMDALATCYLDDLLAAVRARVHSCVVDDVDTTAPDTRRAYRVRARLVAPLRKRYNDPVATALRSTLWTGAAASARRRLMVEAVAVRLEQRPWPSDERARRRRLLTWYRILLTLDRDALGHDSRTLIAHTCLLLRQAGRLDTDIALPRRRQHPFAGAIDRLVGVTDTLGDRLHDDLTDLLVDAATVGGPDAIAHIRLAVLGLLLLQCGFPTALDALTRATWRQMDWTQRRLVVQDADRAHYLPLGLALEFGLHIMQRQDRSRNGLIFPDVANLLRVDQQPVPDATDRRAQSRSADATRRERVAAICTRLRGWLDAPTQMAAVSARRARETMPGWLVEACVDGTSSFRPLMGDGAILQSYIDVAFVPTPAAQETAPPLPRLPALRRPTREPLPSSVEAIIAWARLLIAHCPATVRGREQTARRLREAARRMMTQARIGARSDLGEAIRAALAGTSAALYLNVAALFHYLARRLTHPIRCWLKAAPNVPTGRPAYPRNSTLCAYLSDIVVVLRRIGTQPLTTWTASLCSIAGAQPATARRRNVALAQFRLFAALHLGLTRMPAWTAVVELSATAPFPFPSRAQLDQLFEDLAADEDGEELVLWAAAMLTWGLRLHEAAALLVRDIDLGARGGCLVHHGHAKDRESRWAAAGYSTARAEAALRRRITVAQGERQAAREASRGQRGSRRPLRLEPPLLPSARDVARLAQIERRLIARMKAMHMHPHMLRHVYITLRHVAGIAVRADPDRRWAEWARTCGREMHPLRAAAHAAGHSTTQPTRTVYDQATLWHAAYLRRAGDAVARRPLLTRARLRQFLRYGPQTIRAFIPPSPAGEARLVSIADVVDRLWHDAA